MLVVSRVLSQLRREGQASTAAAKARYFKGVVPEFAGLTSPELQRCFRAWRAEVEALPAEEQLALGRALLRSPVHEGKEFGTHVLAVAARTRANAPALVSLVRDAIAADDAADWATIDGLCCRVLHVAVEDNEELATAVSKFGSLGEPLAASREFLNRASCVAFIKHASPRHRAFHPQAWAAAAAAVRDSRRFAQLGAGWLLRVLGETDMDRVEAFVRPLASEGVLGREGLRYAVEKFPAARRAAVLRDTAPSRKRARDSHGGSPEEPLGDA
jgi:hypothetical protein